MRSMNRFSNIIHITCNGSAKQHIHHLRLSPSRHRSSLSFACKTWLKYNQSNLNLYDVSNSSPSESISESAAVTTALSQKAQKLGIELNKLDRRDVFKVVDKVIAPAFYLSDINYQYLYPDAEDRRTAVYLRFHSLIPKFAAKPHCTASSYVLYDNVRDEHVGHVLLYKPKQNKDAHNGKVSNVLALFGDDHEDDHESNTVKFMRQVIATKWMDKLTSLFRICLLSCAMKNEYQYIDRIINKYNSNCGYWEISGVSIDPNTQSLGYGSMIMRCIHDIVNVTNIRKKQYDNIPTILFTSTPGALKFYLRLGYKVFMEHNINNEITSYSLVFHCDAQVLDEWLGILRENIPYYHSIDKYNLLPKILRPQQQHELQPRIQRLSG